MFLFAFVLREGVFLSDGGEMEDGVVEIEISKVS